MEVSAKPNIRIVIPFYSEFETVKPGLRAMLGSGIEYDLCPSQGSLVHNNRNAGVNNFRSSHRFQQPLEGYSHFLFIDSDIGFNPAHVSMALKHKGPIVVMPYLTHENHEQIQVGELEEDSPLIKMKFSKYERGIRQVTYTGAGFMLVERDVFATLTFPWFHCDLYIAGLRGYSLGEDVVFCNKLKNAKIPILCDFDHPVFHKPRKASDFDVSL